MKRSKLFLGSTPFVAALLFLLLSSGLNAVMASPEIHTVKFHGPSTEITQGESAGSSSYDRKKGKKKKKKNKHLCPAYKS